MGFVDGASSIHSGEHGMRRRRRRHRVDWLQRAGVRQEAGKFKSQLCWMHRSILRQAPVKAVDDAGLKVSQAEGCLYNGVWSSVNAMLQTARYVEITSVQRIGNSAVGVPANTRLRTANDEQKKASVFAITNPWNCFARARVGVPPLAWSSAM
uniref:Uncharacterized protein n=1 Tax=Oryza meridionalis TaxID=40149 RepID=A0A0E0EYM8_9ORYZ